MKLPESIDPSRLEYQGREPCIYWGRRGFGVRVYKTGARSYVLSYRIGGRKRLLTLGEVSEVTIGRAEDLAAAYRLRISEGNDPVVERRSESRPVRSIPKPQSSSSKSVDALCDTYLELHAKHKRSGDSDRRLIERFVRPRWGKLPAAFVTRSQVAMLHADVSKRTPGQANRLLAIVKTMWKKASMWGFVPEDHRNPAIGVQMNKEYPRERFVQPEELPRLVGSIELEPDARIRAALWLYLLTGARKSELLCARWEQVNFERRELHIPRPKQGKPHVYPLSARAMEVLGAMPRHAGNPYIVPGDRSGQHLVNISKAWNRVRNRAGLSDVRLHDLRRSVGSWLAMSGHSLLEIGKVLGHASPRTTQIYARLTDDTARRALDDHAEKLMLTLRGAALHVNGEGDGSS